MLYEKEEEEEEMATLTEHDPLVSSSDHKNSPGPSSGLNKEMSVQEILDQAKFSVLDLMYIIALGLIAIADSMQACYVAIVLPVLTCTWYLSATEIAVVTSLTFTGTGVGGIIIGPLSDRFGRKPTAMTTSFVLFLAMIVTSVAPNVFFFLVFSILSGVCVGGSLSIAYTYWAEVSSRIHRAVGILVITFFWNSGLTAANGLAFLFLNRIGWRSYTLVMALPAIIAVIILAFVPESPKFLNGQNNQDKLLAALRRKLGATVTNFNLDDITIQKEPESDSIPTTTKNSILQSFVTICSGELRCDTIKIVCSYSCLQTMYKGLLYVTAAMLAANFCGLKQPALGSTSATSATGTEDECATLSNGDLLNGIFLSIAFFASTICSIYLTKKIGESWSLKIFAGACLFFNVLMLFCMPYVLTFFNLGMMAFSVSGMSLVFYIILPQMYPTVARNSGFGLVDGAGKLVASVAIFVITAVLNYSVRAAIAVLIVITMMINVQVLLLDNVDRLQSAREQEE